MAVMQPQKQPANSESKPQTVALTRQTGIDPVKALEDPFEMLLGNAYPIITHAELHTGRGRKMRRKRAGNGCQGSRSQHDLNASPLRGKLNSIVKHVLQYFP